MGRVGSGGFTLSGSAGQSSVAIATASGGFTLSGTSPTGVGSAGSGGLVLTGTSPVGVGKVGTGGFTLSGHAVAIPTVVAVASGGFVLSRDLGRRPWAGSARRGFDPGGHGRDRPGPRSRAPGGFVSLGHLRRSPPTARSACPGTSPRAVEAALLRGDPAHGRPWPPAAVFNGSAKDASDPSAKTPHVVFRLASEPNALITSASSWGDARDPGRDRSSAGQDHSNAMALRVVAVLGDGTANGAGIVRLSYRTGGTTPLILADRSQGPERGRAREQLQYVQLRRSRVRHPRPG